MCKPTQPKQEFTQIRLWRQQLPLQRLSEQDPGTGGTIQGTDVSHGALDEPLRRSSTDATIWDLTRATLWALTRRLALLTSPKKKPKISKLQQIFQLLPFHPSLLQPSPCYSPPAALPGGISTHRTPKFSLPASPGRGCSPILRCPGGVGTAGWHRDTPAGIHRLSSDEFQLRGTKCEPKEARQGCARCPSPGAARRGQLPAAPAGLERPVGVPAGASGHGAARRGVAQASRAAGTASGAGKALGTPERRPDASRIPKRNPKRFHPRE